MLVDDTQLPKDYLGAVYLAMITCTSVGYGDFYPTTDIGKLAVCAYAFCSMQVVTRLAYIRDLRYMF